MVKKAGQLTLIYSKCHVRHEYRPDIKEGVLTHEGQMGDQSGRQRGIPGRKGNVQRLQVEAEDSVDKRPWVEVSSVGARERTERVNKDWGIVTRAVSGVTPPDCKP